MNRLVVVAVFLALVRSVLYALVIPPWQAPDEPGHFEYIALIAEGHRPGDTDVLAPLTREINTSAKRHCFECFGGGIDLDRLSSSDPPQLAGPREVGGQKPLYYLLLAPLDRLLHQQTLLVRYYALILTSGSMAAATVFLAAHTARTLFPKDRELQLAIPLIVLFWPTQSFMATAINNDNLATLVSAWCLFGLVRLLRYGLRWPTLFILVTGALMAIYTKRTTLFLVPLIFTGVSAYTALFLAGKLDGQRRRTVIYLFRALAVLLLLAVPVILLSPRLALIVAQAIKTIPLEGGDLVEGGLRLIAGQIQQTGRVDINPAEIIYTLQSVWATFGWGHLYGPFAYQLESVFGSLAALGLLRFAWREVTRRRRMEAWQNAALLLFLLSGPLAWLPILIRMVASPGATGGWPGRYLLTLLIPLSTFLVLGLRQLCPRALRPWLVQALIAGLILFDAVTLSLTLIPYYYG